MGSVVGIYAAVLHEVDLITYSSVIDFNLNIGISNVSRLKS